MLRARLLLLLLLCASPALGDDVGAIEELDLEELLDPTIWSATKVKSHAADVPAIVSVYTRQDLRRWGYTSLADVLRHELGFYVVDDHVLPNVAVRGTSGGLWSESGIVKVMIDGHSVAFRSTGGNFIGPELVPLSAIERVEIIRGPGSALYGADAFLGVINVVTRPGAKLNGADAAAGVNVTGGGLGNDEDVAVGASLGIADVFLSYRHNARDLSGLRLPASSPSPFVPSYARRDDGATGLLQESHAFLGKLALDVAQTHAVLSAWGSAIEREAAFSPWIQLANGIDEEGRNNENHISLAHGHAALRIEQRFSDDVEVSVDTVVFRGAPGARDHVDVGSDVYFIRRSFGFVGVDANLEGRWNILPELTTIAGAGVLWDREDLPSTLYTLKSDSGDLAAGSVLDALSTRQGTQDFLNPAVWAHAMWKPLAPYLELTAGLRYDFHNIYGSALNGRIGVVSEPVEDVNLKVLYGGAFKAPSPLLLYGVPLRPGDIIGNEDLAPQFVHTFESQVAVQPLKNITLSTDVAYNYLINKAEFTQQSGNKIARNLAEAHSVSWETGARVKYPKYIEAYGTFELNLTTRNIGQIGFQADLVGHDNVIYPPLQAHLGVNGGLPELPVRAGAEASFVSARRASDDNILEASKSYELDPYFLLDLNVATVGLQLLPERETTFSLTCRNLLDAVAADPGFAGVDYPLAPRSFFFEARQTF